MRYCDYLNLKFDTKYGRCKFELLFLFNDDIIYTLQVL